MTNIYKTYTADQIENHLSNFLIDSWSYSKVATFSRNEKVFEMQYLYCTFSKLSASTIGGQAYHKALEYFFNKLKDTGEESDIIELEQTAFNRIAEIPANEWKIQKTTPSIQDCIDKATKTAVSGINNFLKESRLYTDEIDTIETVEGFISEWIVVNGVDIPLPCNLVIDLVFTTTDGRRIIADHKLRNSFTDEKEAGIIAAKQAITYTIGYETRTGNKVDEVWFVENKSSKNRDGSPQLNPIKIKMDKSTRRLYESMLYEPLKRMIEAVSNPDYIYIINDNDNFVDKAEIHEFWAQTMLGEIDSFNIPPNKKELIEKRLKKIKDSSLATITPQVLKNFKTYTEQFIPYDLSNKDMTNPERVEHVLRSFGIQSKVEKTFEGISSETMLLEVGAGVPIKKVMSHKLDIANAISVPSVRIQNDLMIYKGKSYLAIESSRKRNKTLYYDNTLINGNRIPIGKDNFGDTIVWDIDNHSTPHMLVCGATGSGKSVFLRSTIEYAIEAGVTDIYIFDPKHEFKNTVFNGNVNIFSDIEEIELEMSILVEEMQSRVKSGSFKHTLIVFDEYADAIANSRKGNDLKNYGEEVVGYSAKGIPKIKRVIKSVDKSLDENMKLLLQKGRSFGFRIVGATQRASTKIIDGDAKVNFPVQVCFRVPKEVDSMVVIDEPGAESLNGYGDGLIKSPEYLNVTRFQAFYKD